MENIVADQDRRQGLIEPVTNPKRLLCPLVAFVGHGAKPHPAYGGVGSFCAGKIAGAEQKE